MSVNTHRGKVGLVGTGMVGSSFAFALMQRHLATELVLVDLDVERAEGEAMDLNHGLPFVSPMGIRHGGYEELAGAEVVAITAGKNQRPGQSRLDLLKQNAEVFHQVVPQVVDAAPGAVIVVATNPVDILTQIAAEHAGSAGVAPGRVLGSGTVLDTARFRYLLGAHCGVNPRSVHAQVIGEHGDSQVPVWSRAAIGGVPLDDFGGPGARRATEADRSRIAEATRSAAGSIIQRKGATYYAIGVALLAILEAVLRDQKTVLTVSTPLAGQHGAPEGISASLPTVVGRSGAEHVLHLPLSDPEADAFRRSAGQLLERYSSLRSPS